MCFGFLFCICTNIEGHGFEKKYVSRGPEIIYQNWVSTPTPSPHSHTKFGIVQEEIKRHLRTLDYFKTEESKPFEAF